ncbi:Ankyrin repeat domain containing protein [Pandoravirus quercus]|uniref:Ankyrin repeat domain containing protein n=1 Tax=Pandoravirus quercus TaxID=2107709 RepID=A0A2U7U7U0_9VIRU|nr:Ankyrin repeat domain containing protein [Pandoravirus quercus]AVK74485.1 Ankyrin repeat domain containing protein [Pandoravirus quercus]
MDDPSGTKRPHAVGDRGALVESMPCGKKHRHSPHDEDDLLAALPDEMVARIFSHIACIDLAVRVRLVSRRSAAIAGDVAALGRGAPCIGSTPPDGRDRMIDRAAAAGHIACLQRAIGRGEPVLARTFRIAAAGGHLAVLVHLAQIPAHPPVPFAIAPDAPAWDEASCSAAAAHGHLDCLVFLHSHGCPWDAWTIAAAECGDHEACAAYARVHGCPEDHPDEYRGVGCWHRDTMRCIHEHRLLGADWHEDPHYNYSDGRLPHPDGIFYAYQHGLRPDVEIVTAILGAHHLALLAYAKACGVRLVAKMCTMAALMAQVDSLAYLHENGCPWDTATMVAGVKSGDMAVFAYLRDHGCPADASAIETEARLYGRVKVLRHLCERMGCTVSAAVMDAAVRRGRADALACLCQRGGTMTPAHLTIAAKASRRVDCLRYLCEHGQRPDAQTMCTAASHGAIDCVRYLHEIGCPWHPDAVAFARARGHYEVVDYIVAHGGA